ncbi:MAG TPA: WD40 repeat domain-containing protein, partial [Actinomycetes bacterium]|nr:WD40 repeat domain-containing protein [Actinomycetes bacterium]
MAAEEPAAPFRGLSPYGEEDAMFFFGRERERRIISANLLAYPLTVLYGATGVGKSSVLRAGAAHHLRGQAEANLRERGRPELAVAAVRNWRDDPLRTIRQAVERALAGCYPKALRDDDPEDLGEALRRWVDAIDGPVLIILDQFEEYFLYRADEDGAGTFAAEFPRLASDKDILANFLVAIREDALAWLDRFKPRLPSLLDNSIRVRHLDRAAAARAVSGPIEAYNRLRPPQEAVEIEPELVEALLEEVRFGRVALGARGQGLAGREQTTDALQGSIETPYLQLVMQRLWEAERARGSRTLRLTTLRDELGGARRIVRTHLDTSIEELPAEEQGIAAAAFQYLVTPSGTKFAHLVRDLSSNDFTGIEQARLLPVMRKLAAARILRQVPPPANQPDESCYEIYHDLLAPAILDWRTRYVENQDREQLERQIKEKQAEAERERQAREREERQHKLALSNELAAVAMGQLSLDPELSVLLAVEAVKTSVTPLAKDALRQSLLECRIRAVLNGHQGDVSRATFSPDGGRIVTASQDTTARVWEAASGRPLATLRGHTDWVWCASFSPDGERIVTASQDGTARVWEAASGRELATLRGHRKAVRAASFGAAGALVVTASDDGTARVWDGRSGTQLQVLPGPSKGVRDAAFTPDGRRVVTGGAER